MQLQLWLQLGNVSRAPTKNTAQVSACLHHHQQAETDTRPAGLWVSGTNWELI